MYRDFDANTYNNANVPMVSNVPHMENVPHVHHAHYAMPVPTYGYAPVVPCYDGGCGGYGHFFALIVVLFILLIIIGTCSFGGHGHGKCGHEAC